MFGLPVAMAQPGSMSKTLPTPLISSHFPLSGPVADPINERSAIQFRRSGIDAEQVAAINLVGDVGQFVGDPIGDDHIGFGLERG